MKKILVNGGFFLIVGIFTYRFIFLNTDYHLIMNLIVQSDSKFLIVGIIMIFLMLALEAYTVQRNLKLLNDKQSFIRCLIYTFTGNFFSGITPAATGGQPMEIYMMHKNGISIVNGSLALVMDLACYQIAVTTLSVISYLMFGNVIRQMIGSYIWLLWSGIFLNMILLLFLLFAMFSNKFIYSLVECISRLFEMLNYQKKGVFKEKLFMIIDQYKVSAELFTRNKVYCLLNCVVVFIRVLFMHSIPYWVYKSAGLSGISLFQIIALQSTLYISCAVLPFPGGIGIAERNFLLFFKNVFPKKILQVSMILSRAIGSYITITLCGIILLIVVIISIFKKRRNIEKRRLAMKKNLTGMYSIAYDQILNLLRKEKLHPLSLKEAKKELIQYLENYQIKNKELEDNDFICNVIKRDKLYRTQYTRVLLWIINLLLCFSIIFVVTFLLNIVFYDDPYRINVLYELAFSLYITFISVEEFKVKNVCIFIVLIVCFSLFGQYLTVQFTNIGIFILPIVCLSFAACTYFFMSKEYKDWKRKE